ncbi:MAG: NADH:flavin oxidoreductase/NADH oxidase [Phycisphaeraceae bacterium]|nr:NADH:flavin oxidoreductase/NADH oxidase [Phycisphaeraceae bacterium]
MSGESPRSRVALFEPLTLRSVTSRNRLMVSPMCQYSAAPPGSADEGAAHDWHHVHLATRAVGGFGIVMTEATSVLPEGRISPYDLGLWNDHQQQALARIAATIRSHGAVAGVQLAHAGPKASHGRPWEDRRALTPGKGGWPIVGPTDQPWQEGGLIPRAMTASDIGWVVQGFRDAACRALSAGFEVVEIHAAHGYLLHSFYSPLTNHRGDDYGGSFDHRVRLLLEVVRAVREVWPLTLPLFVRISATDWVEGGWTVDDSVELARRLRSCEVDVIDCSSGGASPHQRIKAGPGYQAPMAERVRREAGITTAAVGMISQPEQAEQIIAGGQADLVALGRMALWDPYWPHHAAKILGAAVRLPLPYARSDIF